MTRAIFSQNSNMRNVTELLSACLTAPHHTFSKTPRIFSSAVNEMPNEGN